METKQKAAFEIVKAVADCIRELKTIPSGHLYARLMESGNIELDDYYGIINVLKNTGLVCEENNLLIWVEPA